MKRDELDRLRDGTLHLDCINIELRNHDGSRTYSGPGYIRQQKGREFKVTLFVAERLTLKDAFRPLLGPGIAPGLLLPGTHYWTMTATDTERRRWTAERIPNPSPSGHVDAAAHTVSGDVGELTMMEGAPRPFTRARCKMRAFEKVRFPRNQFSKTTVTIGQRTPNDSSKLNVAEFQGSGFQFQLLEEDQETICQAESETEKLHPLFEARVSESLLFALGTRISWSVVEQFQDGVTTTKVRAPEKARRQRAVLAPIAFSLVEHSDVVWRLFNLYLAYVWSDAESVYHRLSTLVLALVISEDGSVEARALTAAVEVESLLDRFLDRSACTMMRPSDKSME